MLPQGVHLIAAPLMGLLLAAVAIMTKEVWGGGWRVMLIVVIAFLPAFYLAHMIAEPLFYAWCWLTDRRRRH